jgi:AcrR family transcriptional regulator
MHDETESPPLRTQPRQKRSQQRVEAILNAASDVFAEVGYDSATTVMIAARANTAVGSLYQFFANKEAILKALVERYVQRASVVFAGMDVEAFPQMTMEEGTKAILLPLKTFIRDNRDFQVIFASSVGSAFLEEVIRPMDEAFLARTDAALALARPHLSARERRKYGLVCMMVMKGLLSLTPPRSDLTLDEVFEEMEAVFVRYLRPIMEGG